MNWIYAYAKGENNVPRCALPEHINDPDEIENAFPDDSQYGGWFGKIHRWINKKTKTWFCFGYRCKFWPKSWKYPTVLLAVGGKGLWRLEHEGGDHATDELSPMPEGHYLSRIQLYKRWHFSIQWPIIITFHFYPKASDVPKPYQAIPDLDGKVWFAYWNHFDADLVYWMITSAYVGRNWK